MVHIISYRDKSLSGIRHNQILDVDFDGMLEEYQEYEVLRPCSGLEDNKCPDFINYYAYMWSKKWRLLEKKDLEWYLNDKYLISRSLYHLCVIYVFLTRIGIDIDIVGNTYPFDMIIDGAKKEKNYSAIEKFVPGYNFGDGFLRDFEPDDTIIKIEKMPLIDKTYCRLSTEKNKCMTNSCIIFKNELCELNFDNSISDEDYQNKILSSRESISNSF